MCMGYPLPKKKQDQIRVDARKRGYIRIYKEVRIKGKHFGACFFRTLYKRIMKARYNKGLDMGFHGFRDYKGKNPYTKIIECLAKPSWIMECGTSLGKKTIKTRYLCFPQYPNTKVTVREFRQLCKQYEV